MTENPRPSSDHIPMSGAAANGKHIALREVLRIVFAYPRLLMILLQAGWRRAFLRVALLSLACGMLVGVSQVRGLTKELMAWAGWLEEEVVAVEVADGEFRWENPEEVPATDYFRGWRIDFRGNADAEVKPEVKKSGYPRGVWVTPEQVLLWFQNGDRSAVRRMLWLKEGRLWGIVEADGKSLRGDEFTEKLREELYVFLPAFVVLSGINVLLQVLLYTAIFAIIPCILRSPLAAGGFKSIFSFYLYASIPALVAATVYSAIGFAALGFNTIFVTAFIIYLIFAMWQVGRAIRVPRDER